jgi:hypothetical protein
LVLMELQASFVARQQFLTRHPTLITLARDDCYEIEILHSPFSSPNQKTKNYSSITC